MKKRSIPKSVNAARLDSSYGRSLAEAQMMAKGSGNPGRRDPSYEKYPPCIICKEGGTLARKCFFPLDFMTMLKSAGSTFCVAICPACFNKLLNENEAYQCTSYKEVGERIK